VTAGAVRAGAGEATRCTVRVPVEAAALWRLLRDPEQVARCLPGASLPSGADADPLVFRMEVALGPMRVGFEGTASIDYRDADRRAHVTARGEDARTRTRGEGTLVFTVREAGAGASELEVSLEYALTGPLAQFSRAPVVDALVAQLLERFAANAARLGAGQEVEEQAALSAGAFGMQALWRWIRERFGR
jgi:carbon-monoxide dehydrogenase small subunit